LNSVLNYAVQYGSFNVLSVKSTERLYTNGSVYNGCIQIWKNSEICTLFRIHDILAQEWPILANHSELKEL